MNEIFKSFKFNILLHMQTMYYHYIDKHIHKAAKHRKERTNINVLIISLLRRPS